ncbi:MAG TPA: hypothetical protein VGB42_03210 [Candidatus Thermoplasmatota archaeon]
MAPMGEAGGAAELDALRTEVAQLREIVAALVNLVVENQGASDGDAEWEDDSFLPEVGTGTKFGWGM